MSYVIYRQCVCALCSVHDTILGALTMYTHFNLFQSRNGGKKHLWFISRIRSNAVTSIVTLCQIDLVLEFEIQFRNCDCILIFFGFVWFCFVELRYMFGRTKYILHHSLAVRVFIWRLKLYVCRLIRWLVLFLATSISLQFMLSVCVCVIFGYFAILFCYFCLSTFFSQDFFFHIFFPLYYVIVS